jgi:hypothetical protein
VALGTAEDDREVVADEFEAADSEDGGSADQARLLLLATVCREPSDAATVWKYVAADRSATRSKR